MSRFNHRDFAASMFAKLREHKINLETEDGKAICRRVNTLSWKRGRWTGELAWEVLAMVEQILEAQNDREKLKV